jgi:hypothetical protein
MNAVKTKAVEMALRESARELCEDLCSPTNWTLVVSEARHRHIMPLRRAVAARLRAEGWSLPAIGQALDRDPTTARDLAIAGAKVEARKPGGVGSLVGKVLGK